MNEHYGLFERVQAKEDQEVLMMNDSLIDLVGNERAFMVVEQYEKEEMPVEKERRKSWRCMKCGRWCVGCAKRCDGCLMWKKGDVHIVFLLHGFRVG